MALTRKPNKRQRAWWKAIHRARLQGLSKRAIAKNLGISRNTVKKYLAAESPEMVALTACARKLLTILNSMARTGVHWDPTAPRTWHRRRLLYMSSGVLKYLDGLADDRVDFASDIAFKATNDFYLAHSICGSSTQISLRPEVVAQPDDDYAI